MENNNEDIELKLEEQNDVLSDLPNTYIMTNLSDANRRYAEEFSKGINISNRTMVLQYGSEAQKKVIHFTESSLFSIPANDLAQIDEDIKKVLTRLSEFESSFYHAKNINNVSDEALSEFRSMYERFSSALSEGARRFEIHRSSLIRHMKRMDEFYAGCMQNIREFDMYIYAGRLALARTRNEDLVQLAKKAKDSGLTEDTIVMNDLSNACALFEKKLDDLAASRALPMQTMAQIRLIQSTDTAVAESLHRMNTDVIPLYRNRIVLSLGLQHSGDTDSRIIHEDTFKEANQALKDALNALRQVKDDNVKKQKKGISLFGK